MNKLIKEQLSKVSSTHIEFDDDTLDIYIPKVENILSSSVKVGGVYKIKLDESLLSPSSTSTFAANWNAGRIPHNEIYTVDIIDSMPGYVKCNGVADNNSADNWFGWLPIDKISILERY